MLEMEQMGGSELFQRQIVELREKINDMERVNQAKQDVSNILEYLGQRNITVGKKPSGYHA